MGLFARFTSRNKNPLPDHSENQQEQKILLKESRLHARLKLNGPDLASLTLADGNYGVIADLSYGGIAVKFDNTTPSLTRENQLAGTLKLLDRQLPITLRLIRTAGTTVTNESQSQLAAFMILHEETGSLLFLREFIEPYRLGETLNILATSLRQERYQSNDWHCYRGDGPIDLIVRCEPNTSKPVEALLTYRLAGTYWETAWSMGKIRTGRVIVGSNISPKMGTDTVTSTQTVDLDALRTAVIILTASPHHCRHLTQILIDDAKKMLFHSVTR